MNRELEDKLKEIKIEDNIWVIYIGIILLSWYANNLERKYFIYKDYISKEKYRHIMILIFSILLVVYYYFFNDSLKGINSLGYNTKPDKIKLNYLSLLASIFIFLSGVIFLYIAVEDKDIDVEIAFN